MIKDFNEIEKLSENLKEFRLKFYEKIDYFSK